MSIINEALKKTEERLQSKALQDNSLSPKASKTKTFLFYILILSAGIMLGNFIFFLLKNKIQTVQTPKQDTQTVVQAANPPAEPVLPSESLEKNKPPQANFILNGIFFSNHDSYALINNQIVRENDYIEGAKVSLITVNSVELDSAGKTITLASPR